MLPLNWISAVGHLMRSGPAQTGWVWDDRRGAYALWDAYYHNSVYEPRAQGGQRESINEVLGNAEAADLAGLYNPVANVVDLYQQVFGGVWGQQIRCTGSPGTLAALSQVWKWSNMSLQQQSMQRLAATHGTVGLRIVADVARRQVRMKPEHPRIIRDVEYDDRGNVIAIELEYLITTGVGSDAETITVAETMTKEGFWFTRTDRGTAEPWDVAAQQVNGPRSSYANTLGVVPYVLLQHTSTGDAWGYNAFYRARTPIDRLNALLTHINTQIHRHVRAKWLLAAAGSPPTEIDLGDLTVAYVNTQGVSGPPPVMEPMVANLSLAEATAQAAQQIAIIEDMLPELKALAGKYLAGQSGQTIAQLRRPAEDAILLARANYEDAVVRAQQIALSWGIVLGLWDLGTGMGTAQTADNAYTSGAEDHAFVERPAFRQDAAASPTPTPVVSAPMPSTPGAINA